MGAGLRAEGLEPGRTSGPGATCPLGLRGEVEAEKASSSFSTKGSGRGMSSRGTVFRVGAVQCRSLTALPLRATDIKERRGVAVSR